MKKILPLLLLSHTSFVSANTTAIYPDQLKNESLGALIDTELQPAMKRRSAAFFNSSCVIVVCSLVSK